MKNVETVYAISVCRDYGENKNRGSEIIGVAMNHNTAVEVMEKAFDLAKNAFLNHIHKNGHSSDECIAAEHENSRKISLYIPDETMPDFECVIVHIETTILYSDWEKPASCIAGCEWKHDDITGITFMIGKCDLKANGFTPIAKLKNMQNKQIGFWRKDATGEVAISLNNSDVPTRIFQNKTDGNRWFMQYIKPMHGDKIIPVEIGIKP